MTIFTKAKNWYYQHRIEAFGYILTACLILMMIDVGFIKYTKTESDIKYEVNHSVYVKNFTSSLSAQEGEIVKMYRSTDAKRVAIMLRFKNISKVVTDASKYKIFYKGYNISEGGYASKTKSNPSGGYVVFKQSGISMIYLNSDTGFEPQAVEIVVRCDDVLSTMNKNSEATQQLAKVDSSYAQYDQFRIVVNPAGTDMEISTALDEPTFNAENLYRDAFVSAEEKQIRAALKSDIDTMAQQLSRINEYHKNLVDMKVMVPEYDTYIYGDVFEENQGDKSVTNYLYTPNNVMEGGVAYAWWGYTLKNGSFLDYKPESMAQLDDASYIAKLGSDQSLTMQMTPDFNESQVRMANGELLKLDENSSIQNTQVITTTVHDYITACNAYIAAKQKYLCKDMKDYCVLEYNMKTTGNSYTINMTPNTITVW